MATHDEQENLFNKLRKAHMIVGSMASMFQNDFEELKQEDIKKMLAEFNAKYDELRKLMVHAKEQGNTLVNQFLTKGYSKPKHLEPTTRDKHNTDMGFRVEPDDLPF